MGCNRLRGAVFLGFGFDAADFKSLKKLKSDKKRCENDDDDIYTEGEKSSFKESDEKQDWSDITYNMYKVWSMFIRKKRIPEYSRKCSRIRFHHFHRQIISNYESDPGDSDGYIVLGYFKPSTSLVGEEHDSLDKSQLNAHFPKKCGELLKEFLKKYLTARGSKRNSPDVHYGFHVAVGTWFDDGYL